MTELVSRKETAMWLLEQLVPDTGVNNISVTFEVAGRLDPATLSRALGTVLDRYDVLRTVFHAEDATLTKRVLAPGEVEPDVRPIPLSGNGIEADLMAFTGGPFAFDGTPMVRAGIVSDVDKEVFCFVAHHLIFDAMSTTILQRALVAAYDAIAAGSEPAGARVAPMREREPDPRSLTYWRTQLTGIKVNEAGLSCGKPDVATPTLVADTTFYSLSEPARAVVARLQKELRASEAVVLLAAYYLLLSLHGAGSDVVIGSPVNIRDQANLKAIGYHANLLPLRVNVDSEATFKTLVGRTRNTFLEAISHADVPLELVSLEVIGDAPASWRSSFFRHLFNYLPGSADNPFTIGGLPAKPKLIENGYSRFDLEFFIMPSEQDLRIRAAYCTDVFDEPVVQALLERYDALLTALGDGLDSPVGELASWGELVAQPAAPAVPAPIVAEAPRELVDSLIAAWQELLGRQDITAESNFFACGGHSLLGAQLVQRLKKSLGLPVKLGDLFGNPTPQGLADHLSGQG